MAIAMKIKIEETDPYYPIGMYGQQETGGRTVLQELTAKNVTTMLAHYSTYPTQIEFERIVRNAILLAKETIKQLNLE